MNEMLEQLKIDPEFEKVIPPLTKDEYHQLEENILDDGRIMMPIAVWGDIIVDGHNRYRIAREYGDVPFSTTQLDFANRYEAIAWICKNQLAEKRQTKENFVKAVRSFMEMKTLNPVILRELIEKIEVYQIEGTGKNRTQRVIIHYRFVGCLQIPEWHRKRKVTLESRQGVAVNYLPTTA